MAIKEQFPINEKERTELLNSLPKELQEFYANASTEEIKSIKEKRTHIHFAPSVDEKNYNIDEKTNTVVDKHKQREENLHA
ncbi:MAG: hypothetical protein AAB696_02215 [Patescibacteria group bacterium]|mgnify:CR=1 FL=1